MRYTHVIWDFNGTLLDDTQLCWQITNDMLVSDGREPISFTQYREWLEYPILGYYEKLGYRFTSEEFAAASEDYHRIYDSRLEEAGLQEGIVAVLEALRDAGLTQSILSAYHQEGLEAAVKSLGINGFFIDIIGLSDKLGGSKVQQALAWMEHRALNPDEMVMVGDTIHDAEVAAALGCGCVLFSGGHNDRKRLAESGMPVIDHMDELLPLLGVSYSV
jgi:phosphoglycolate phosphatase